ncbi:unnamed protein product [Rotaria sp. Silwood1]|nr:unnamed protein product [Rotaria sp. Silwood1]
MLDDKINIIMKIVKFTLLYCLLLFSEYNKDKLPALTLILQSLSRSAWQSWESVTIIPCLTKNRLSIHLLHRQACLNNQSIYIDPESGLQVLTRYAHLQRGKCCGNQCRHCPYGHINAEINFSRPQKIFNTSYYE